DGKRIGLLGRSEGSWIAGLAASRLREIAFLITESGGGVSARQQLLYMHGRQLRRAGVSDIQVGDALALLERCLDAARTGEDWPAVEAEVNKACDEKWFKLLPVRLPKTHWFWKSMALTIDYDPATALGSVHCPILVVLGERDDSTPAEATADRFAE